MNFGSQLVKIISVLKDKNQMDASRVKDYGTEYHALTFTTNIEGNKYTVEKFTEINPNWKDAGVKGDYVNILTVTDKNNVELYKLSSCGGNDPSFILLPKGINNINLEQLTKVVNDLEMLPKKEISTMDSIVSNIQKMKEINKPEETKKIIPNYFEWR